MIKQGDQVKVSENAMLTGYEHMQKVAGPHPKAGQWGVIETALEAEYPAFSVLFSDGESWMLPGEALEPVVELHPTGTAWREIAEVDPDDWPEVVKARPATRRLTITAGRDGEFPDRLTVKEAVAWVRRVYCFSDEERAAFDRCPVKAFGTAEECNALLFKKPAGFVRSQDDALFVRKSLSFRRQYVSSGSIEAGAGNLVPCWAVGEII